MPVMGMSRIFSSPSPSIVCSTNVMPESVTTVLPGAAEEKAISPSLPRIPRSTKPRTTTISAITSQNPHPRRFLLGTGCASGGAAEGVSSTRSESS